MEWVVKEGRAVPRREGLFLEGKMARAED